MKEVIDVSGQKVKIINNLIKQSNKAFVYLDPPYYPLTKCVNKLYNSDFLPIDFLRLKERCDNLTKTRIPFILHNSNCEFIRILFKDYIIIEIDEARVIKQGKGKGSRPSEKCLIITNFKQKKDFMGGINQMNNLMKEK